MWPITAVSLFFPCRNFCAENFVIFFYEIKLLFSLLTLLPQFYQCSILQKKFPDRYLSGGFFPAYATVDCLEKKAVENSCKQLARLGLNFHPCVIPWRYPLRIGYLLCVRPQAKATRDVFRYFCKMIFSSDDASLIAKFTLLLCILKTIH